MSDIIAPFQSRYQICTQVSSISTAATFDGSAVGIKTGDCQLLLKGEPHISPGLNLIDNLKATGQALRKTNEYVLGNNRPNVTINFDFNANMATLMFWSLLQGGLTESGSGVFVKTGIPYTDPAATMWLSFTEINKTSENESNNAGHGGIVTQLTLRADEEAQILDAEAQISFASYVDGYDASGDTIDDPLTTELVFKNMSATLGGDGINIPSFEVTFNNNAVTRFFHNPTAIKHVLGKLEISGSFVIPRDAGHTSWDKNQMITNLLAKTDMLLTLYWGATPAASDQDLSIAINVLITDVEKVTETELGWSVPFVVADDETNNLVVTFSDNIDRVI